MGILNQFENMIVHIVYLSLFYLRSSKKIRGPKLCRCAGDINCSKVSFYEEATEGSLVSSNASNSHLLRSLTSQDLHPGSGTAKDPTYKVVLGMHWNTEHKVATGGSEMGYLHYSRVRHLINYTQFNHPRTKV